MDQLGEIQNGTQVASDVRFYSNVPARVADLARLLLRLLDETVSEHIWRFTLSQQMPIPVILGYVIV